MPYSRRKTRWDLFVLSGEPGVSRALLTRWHIGGGYMDVSVFYGCGKIYVQKTVVF